LGIAGVRSSIFARSVLTRLKRYSLAIPHGATDSDKVIDELRKTKVNDAFVQDGVIRADGLVEYDMYIMEVKKPSESKGEWDYYKLLSTMKGEAAFGKLADWACPLVKK
jgi:branched-chain amino acid transport system substrate-binding protein